MTQEPLFAESLNDAAWQTVKFLGGYKVVGQLIQPEKSIDAAKTWLSDCLNPDRQARLNPDQLLLLARLGREKGCHILATHFLREAGYADPVPVEPEDIKAALMLKLIESQKQMQIIMDRWTKLSA